MSGANGKTPVAVPQAGKRAGEARLERPSAEPAIWTKRMLATLEQGVTGGKWYSLIDKLYPVATLEAAFAAVKANQGAAGVDHVSIEDCAAKLETNLARLSESLRTGVYRPQAIRRHDIPKHVLGPAEGRTRGREAGRNGRWASRRCRTAWCRRHCACCWSRSLGSGQRPARGHASSGSLPRRATASVPTLAARMPFDGWMSC